MRRFFYRQWRLMIFLAVALVFIWGVGLSAFIRALPKSVENPSAHTDAIVVLTGGSLRLEAGLQLLAEAKAEKLLISGVKVNTSMDDLLHQLGAKELATRITPGYQARDTRGNARETARWIRKNGYRSLRLVTSAYHMPRSLLEFRSTLPQGTRILAYPVFPEHVRIDKWFLNPGTAILLAGEYSKFLLAKIRQSLPAMVGVNDATAGRGGVGPQRNDADSRGPA